MDTPDWTREYFERGYAQRWRLSSPTEAVRREVTGIRNLLQLSLATRVIDIGCGHGRHALALAERGAAVVGIDFSASLLDRARHLAVQQPARPSWIRGDMRALPCRSECAGGAIILDAFGFFDTDAEHDQVLREAARVLMIGARLVLKVVNGTAILNDFRESEREERDGTIVTVSNRLTHEPLRLIQRVSVAGVGGGGEYERRQRLYSASELRAAIEWAGLSFVGVFASPDEAPFDSDVSPTMWMVGEQASRKK